MGLSRASGALMRPKKESTQRQQRSPAVEFVLRDFFLLMKFEFLTPLYHSPFYNSRRVGVFSLAISCNLPHGSCLKHPTKAAGGLSEHSPMWFFVHKSRREQTPDLPVRVAGAATGIRVGSKEIFCRGRRTVWSPFHQAASSASA